MSNEGKVKVLIAIDSSEWSINALNWYAENIHRKNHEVLCYNCAEQPPIQAGHPYVTAVAMGDFYDESMKAAIEKTKTLEDEYAERMKAKKIYGKIVAKFAGKPGEAIVEEAAAEKVDMIVMGTRGLGTIRRTILGSVSTYVLHHAPCPVVICCHPDRK